jgi:hypothetical protein
VSPIDVIIRRQDIGVIPVRIVVVILIMAFIGEWKIVSIEGQMRRVRREERRPGRIFSREGLLLVGQHSPK